MDADGMAADGVDGVVATMDRLITRDIPITRVTTVGSIAPPITQDITPPMAVTAVGMVAATIAGGEPNKIAVLRFYRCAPSPAFCYYATQARPQRAWVRKSTHPSNRVNLPHKALPSFKFQRVHEIARFIHSTARYVDSAERETRSSFNCKCGLTCTAGIAAGYGDRRNCDVSSPAGYSGAIFDASLAHPDGLRHHQHHLRLWITTPGTHLSGVLYARTIGYFGPSIPCGRGFRHDGPHRNCGLDRFRRRAIQRHCLFTTARSLVCARPHFVSFNRGFRGHIHVFPIRTRLGRPQRLRKGATILLAACECNAHPQRGTAFPARTKYQQSSNHERPSHDRQQRS